MISVIGWTQKSPITNDFSVSSYIIDSESKQPIPYATIYNMNRRTGSISNLDGYFKLENVQPSDSISIFFIGYGKHYYLARELSKKDTIYLKESASLLNKVTLLSDDAFLYELVAKSRKTVSYEPKTAKAYFELETYANGEQIELVETYYNGSFKGYNVDELAFNNGRLALKGMGQSLHVSTSTSRAILMHKLTETNTYFPKMPFEYNKFKMRRYYSLGLASSYKDEKLNTIYVINFKPRSEEYF